MKYPKQKKITFEVKLYIKLFHWKNDQQKFTMTRYRRYRLSKKITDEFRSI